jgi:LCP family protein required for cell wall assembly
MFSRSFMADRLFQKLNRKILVIIVLFTGLGLEGCVWYQRTDAPRSGSPPVSQHTHVTPRSSVATHPLSLGQFLVLPKRPTSRLNFLIAGVTPEYTGYHRLAPENFTGLTDSMILAQLDPEHNTVRMLSLPRDTQVRLGDLGVHKLNAAIALEGSDGLQKAVEQLTGLNLSGYVLINLNAVHDLTEAVGGVQVYVAEAMNYDDTAANLHIHFPIGMRRLTGPEAAAYIRFRHDALGDIGRVKRQQAFLLALGKELLSPRVMLHLPALSTVLSDDTRTDATQSDVSAALGMLLSHPKLETYLYPGRFLTQDGVSYWEPDQVTARSVLSQQFGNSVVPPRSSDTSSAEVSIRVVDTGAKTEVVRGVLKALALAGEHDVRLVRSAGGDPAQTVLLSQGDPAVLKRVHQELGFGETRMSGEGVLNADVTIWLGSDARIPGSAGN